MKKTRQTQPKSNLTVLRQVCNLIPGFLVSKLARKHGCEKQARSFSPWSHVVSLIYGQLTHAMSLHDICDALQNHSGTLGTVRGATAPHRNTFSNANRRRDPKMAEELFWRTLEYLQGLSPFCRQILGLSEQLASQHEQDMDHDTGGSVEPFRPYHFVAKTWDSRWMLSSARTPRTSVFTRLWRHLMGQPGIRH